MRKAARTPAKRRTRAGRHVPRARTTPRLRVARGEAAGLARGKARAAAIGKAGAGGIVEDGVGGDHAISKAAAIARTATVRTMAEMLTCN
mgnify:FL=1